MYRLFGDVNEIKKFVFNYLPLADGCTKEFYNSERFGFLYNQSMKQNSKPLILLVFIDDFRKFRSASGNLGGFYFTFLNFKKKNLSKTENIKLISLLEKDSKKLQLKSAINELLEITKESNIYSIFNEKSKKYENFKFYIGLLLMDTPERLKNLNVVGVKGNRNCSKCNAHKDDFSTEKIGEERTVKDYFKKYEQYSNLFHFI